jgi:hypothetical protein
MIGPSIGSGRKKGEDIVDATLTPSRTDNQKVRAFHYGCLTEEEWIGDEEMKAILQLKLYFRVSIAPLYLSDEISPF